MPVGSLVGVPPHSLFGSSIARVDNAEAELLEESSLEDADPLDGLEVETSVDLAE